MKKDSAVHLLVIDDSFNDTEMYNNTLRNIGLAIRLVRVTDAEDMQEALTKKPPHIILCAQKLEDFSIKEALQLLQQAKLDIPLIAIAKAADQNFIVECMQAGASDVVAKTSMEHLQLVVQRELESYREHSELGRLLVKLAENEARVRGLMESSRDAITYIHEGVYAYANPAYLNMFGYADPEDLDGLTIMDMVASEGQKAFKDFLRKQSRNPDKAASLEVKAQHSAGKTLDVVMEFSPATVDGEDCTQIVIRDQANKKELEEKIRALSSRDGLTGLYNRQYILETLDERIQAGVPSEGGGALLYITLDDFQAVRNVAGISGGDEILKEVGGLLQTRAGEADILARFGDDEFTFFSADPDQEKAKALAESFLAEISEHAFKSTGKFVAATYSIGIAFLMAHAKEAQDLIAQAYTASGIAQSEGGNRASLHDPLKALKQAPEQDKQYIDLVRHSLAQNRFRLLFQPIASLKGDEMENYEVLLRMMGENDESISPKEFLKSAQEGGMMKDLDRWVIKNALNTLGEKHKQGQNLRFFMKLSVASLADEQSLVWIIDTLRSSNVNPDWAVFQTIDADVRDHIQEAKAFSEGLQRIQGHFGLDHFGISAQAANYLKRIPVSFLKVDGTFSQDLVADKDKQEAFKEIQQVAQSFDIKTIATCVEDANSLASLWTVGVDYIQGYFLQEPAETLNFDFSS